MSVVGHPMSLPGYDRWLATEPEGYGTCADDVCLVRARCTGPCAISDDEDLSGVYEAEGLEDSYGNKRLTEASRWCFACGGQVVAA